WDLERLYQERAYESSRDPKRSHREDQPRADEHSATHVQSDTNQKSARRHLFTATQPIAAENTNVVSAAERATLRFVLRGGTVVVRVASMPASCWRDQR